MIPIRYVDWGIANRFDDCIELNKNLKDYPELQGKILKHELKHTDRKFTMYDLKHDLDTGNQVSQKEILKFIIKNPKALSQFLPFYYNWKRKIFVYDLNLILTYSSFLLMVGATIFLASKYI